MQFVLWIGGAAVTAVVWKLLRRYGVDTVATKVLAATSGKSRADADLKSHSQTQLDLWQPRPPAPALAAAREAWLRREMQHLGAEWFPDDRQCDWLVHGFEHRGALTLVEVEPRPPTVGYPRFKFVASFAAADSDRVSPATAESGRCEDPDILAVYCLQNGRYSLLGTAPGAKERLPAVLTPMA